MIKVAIDAGHGGPNTGCVHGNSWERLVEKDYTLEVAHLLYDSVADLSRYVQPILIRDGDEEITLTQRADISARKGAHLHLHLHVNAWKSYARGFMAFHWPTNVLAKDVAEHIAYSAPLNLRHKAIPVHPALRDKWDEVRNVMRPVECDNVLLEFGYASNDAERKELLKHTTKLGIVNALRSGIIHYLALKEQHAAVA